MKNRYAKVNKKGKKILKHENKRTAGLQSFYPHLQSQHRIFYFKKRRRKKEKTQTKLTLAFETSITA